MGIRIYDILDDAEQAYVHTKYDGFWKFGMALEILKCEIGLSNNDPRALQGHCVRL